MMFSSYKRRTATAPTRRTGGGSGGGRGEVLLSHSTNLSRGVGFLFSRAFSPRSLEVKHIIEGRLFLVKARFDLFTVVFTNVYAPTTGAVFIKK